MAAYWPSSFLCIYGLGWSRSKKRNKQVLRDTARNPDNAILPVRVTQPSAGLGSSCLLTELAR